jgi:hypothetical protein
VVPGAVPVDHSPVGFGLLPPEGLVEFPVTTGAAWPLASRSVAVRGAQDHWYAVVHEVGYQVSRVWLLR